MHPHRPLPPELPAAFTVAEAHRLGVERGRLRGSDLERPFHGVRSRGTTGVSTSDPAEDLRTDLRRFAQAYATRMQPQEFFSHRTAATLWEIPLPALSDVVLDVSVLRPGRAPRSVGVRGHQAHPRLVRVTDHNGFRLASPASTWASLGPLLHPYDLVAAGDAIVCQRASAGDNGFSRAPLATVDQLRAAVDAGRRPGVGALRDALGRIRPGSWSRLETWVRLILVDAGLPEPKLNYDAFDAAGNFLGCIDLAYPELKIAIEYEGAHHWQTADQFTHDIDRLNRLIEAGWRIVRLTSRHVFSTPTEVVRRVSVARAQSGATV